MCRKICEFSPIGPTGSADAKVVVDGVERGWLVVGKEPQVAIRVEKGKVKAEKAKAKFSPFCQRKGRKIVDLGWVAVH